MEGENDGKPKGHRSPVRLKKSTLRNLTCLYIRTAGKETSLLSCFREGEGGRRIAVESGKQNTHDEMTQDDGLSALQIFMITQTFVFILSRVQMVLVKTKTTKPTKEKNPTRF